MKQTAPENISSSRVLKFIWKPLSQSIKPDSQKYKLNDKNMFIKIYPHWKYEWLLLSRYINNLQ